MTDKNIWVDFTFNKNQLLKVRIENLTTLQIASLASTLTSNDKGLIIYDITLFELKIWNGNIFTNISSNISNIPNLQQVSEQGDNSTIRLKFDGENYAVISDIPTPLTNEQIQDAVFGILTDTPTIDLNYDDATNQVTAEVKNNSITLAKQSNVANNTVFYRKTAGVGSPEVQTLATLKTDLGLNNVVNLDTSTTTNVSEGTNLYFTVVRVLATVLTGFSANAGTVTTTDTILQAFNKIVGNIALKLNSNTAIVGATKTKITYDANGLITSGVDATTADIVDSINKRYVTDANLTVIGNTSGTNTGDNATNNLYSGLVSNATHTGDVTGATVTTIAANVVTNVKLAQMPANTVKLNNTNALANSNDYNLPLGTVLGNFNGNIEGIILEETIDIKRRLTAGTYVYSNPLLTVNSGCLGWSWTETTGHTSVPLSCVPANGSMTFTTSQVGDVAEFVAFIKFNIL